MKWWDKKNLVKLQAYKNAPSEIISSHYLLNMSVIKSFYYLQALRTMQKIKNASLESQEIQ